MPPKKTSGKPPGQVKKEPVDSSSVSSTPAATPSVVVASTPRPEVEPVRYPDEPPGKTHYDEIDVPFALARVTQDGRGDEEPGPSNWTGYASPDAVREAGT